jgi:hypothetical protein
MKTSQKPTPEGRRAEKALKKAVAGVVAEHRRLGLPIAVMRKGKAVYVHAEEMVPTVREGPLRRGYKPAVSKSNPPRHK